MSEIILSVTFRHLEPTAALKNYVEDKIHKIAKYFSHSLDAHVILAVDAKQRQMAEVELHAHGAFIHGKEQHQNLYAAIDLVLDKIERQVRKQKAKSTVSRRRKKA